MNITVNPWSFVPTDVATQGIALVGVPGLSQAANGVITVQLTGAPSFPLTVGNEYLIAGAGVAGYNGLIQCLTSPGGNLITGIASPKHPLLASPGTALANSGSGTLQPGPQWTSYVRIEDLNWMGEVTQGDVILVQDQNGNDIWNSTASGPGGFNRGKLFWVNGLWVKTLDSGELVLTIN